MLEACPIPLWVCVAPSAADDIGTVVRRPSETLGLIAPAGGCAERRHRDRQEECRRRYPCDMGPACHRQASDLDAVRARNTVIRRFCRKKGSSGGYSLSEFGVVSRADAFIDHGYGGARASRHDPRSNDTRSLLQDGR